MSGKLTEAQREVLDSLDSWRLMHIDSGTSEWARPMDVGGSNGSHHSGTLAALVRKGLAERQQRSAWMSRGSWVYRITPAGRSILAQEDK